jgi:enediyne biosynthesis protein E4
MDLFAKLLRREMPRIVAVLICVSIYLPSRMQSISASSRQTMAARFRFERHTLPVIVGPEVRNIRPVHPSLRHISAWISSVGAGVALADLDGDGLPNDLCYIDVRTDQVIIAPVPGTGDRYPPFALDAGALFSRATMAPMGCLPGDMNEDGKMDVLVYYWGRTPLAFLHQQRAMNAISFKPMEIVPGGARWFTNAATFADLDGDGHPDLIIGNYFADGSRILDASAPGKEQMQDSMSRAFNGGGPHLLLWKPTANGLVGFQEVINALPNEASHGWTLAIGAADLNGDLLPEIYLANDFGPDRLFLNRSAPGHLSFQLLQGRRTLNVPASKVLGKDSFKGMGVDFYDMNGDGIPDMFVSNITAPYALEESNFVWMSTGRSADMQQGVAPYFDQSETLGLARSGWSWDARLDDFDNDGVPEALQAVGFLRGTVNRWPELHEIAMGNDQLLSNASVWHNFTAGDDLSGHLHNPFYVRGPDGRYYDIAAEMGMAEAHVSRGIAIADVDGDGRLDYAVANQWEDSYFYHNQSPAVGAFLGLRIKRNGVAVIGAEASVWLPDGRRMTAQSDGGSGHSGKRSPDIHFGLGKISKQSLLRVQIRWRDELGVHQRQYALTPAWHTVDLEGGV